MYFTQDMRCNRKKKWNKSDLQIKSESWSLAETKFKFKFALFALFGINPHLLLIISLKV